jgi:hypothetical protein
MTTDDRPDPYAWTPPDAPRETWSDADWLRDMARSNFVTEDIARADKIATMLDGLASIVAVMRTDLDMLAEAVVADVAAELKHVKTQLEHVREAVTDWPDVGTAQDAIDRVGDVLAGRR